MNLLGITTLLLADNPYPAHKALLLCTALLLVRQCANGIRVAGIGGNHQPALLVGVAHSSHHRRDILVARRNQTGPEVLIKSASRSV